jgi:hypothetical protein
LLYGHLGRVSTLENPIYLPDGSAIRLIALGRLGGKVRLLKGIAMLPPAERRALARKAAAARGRRTVERRRRVK